MMAISFKGAHFPQDIILMGVRWYVAYPLSYRHVEELLEERGVPVDHATIQRWLLHVPVPQTRVVRSYGLYHPTQAEALAVCRAQLGQPPVEVPVPLDWQTVCAQRGARHPEQGPTCGQLLVGTGGILRGGVSPPTRVGERAA